MAGSPGMAQSTITQRPMWQAPAAGRSSALEVVVASVSGSRDLLSRSRGFLGLPVPSHQRHRRLGLRGAARLDIYLAGGDPHAYDELLAFYASPAGRVLEILLGAALLYHALNGMRILIIDLWPAMTVHHRRLWWGSWVIFVVVGVPGALIILRPYWKDTVDGVTWAWRGWQGCSR